MDRYCPFLKYWILLWTRLTGASEQECASEHSAAVSPHIETGAVRVSVAGLGVSSSVQTAGIDQ